MDGIVNVEEYEYWNSDQSSQWVRHQRHYDEMLAPWADALLEGAAVTSSERVLDVGCGCGATTLAAARFAEDGETVGIDLSRAMLDVARRRAHDDGVANVSFEQADAQVHPLEGRDLDVVISRFGAMFFADPVAAFVNLASGLRPGGRMVLVVWQDLGSNGWLSVPASALLAHLPPPDFGQPGAPGPFSLADPDRVRQVLTDAGLRDVAAEPTERHILLGGKGSLDDAVDFLREMGPVRGMTANAPPETVSRAFEAARAALAEHLTDDGVLVGSAAWLVTARR